MEREVANVGRKEPPKKRVSRLLPHPWVLCTDFPSLCNKRVRREEKVAELFKRDLERVLGT